MARVSTLPKKMQPMLATLTDAPFDDKDWIFEDKYDGFRMVAFHRSCSDCSPWAAAPAESSEHYQARAAGLGGCAVRGWWS
uniref:hypothetical protein n=1 Tax=Bradyrhizobium sp. Oc8 TaxID=2876780 RepID=UPI001F376FE7|nr:hypothetical protein [Bradyrhizobium sp. Oc8]